MSVGGSNNPTMNYTGRKIALKHYCSDMSTLTFRATIVAEPEGDRVRIRVPLAVTQIPFPPFDGKRFLTVSLSKVSQSII